MCVCVCDKSERRGKRREYTNTLHLTPHRLVFTFEANIGRLVYDITVGKACEHVFMGRVSSSYGL